MPGEEFHPNDPSAIREGEPTSRVTDDKKAEHMAYAGDKLRTEAADDRLDASEIEENRLAQTRAIERGEGWTEGWQTETGELEVLRREADTWDRNADFLEERAGKAYDEEHAHKDGEEQAEEAAKEADDVVLDAVGVEDPIGLREGEESFVVNKDKANAMAEASDDSRTSAAVHRSEAQYDAEREEKIRSAMSEEDDEQTTYLKERDLRGARESKKMYLREAEKYDREADRREEWAGILHDHPVSQAYAAAHPEVRYTPEGLALFEDHIDLLEGIHEANSRSEEALKNLDSPEWGGKFLPRELVRAEMVGADEVELVVEAEDDEELAELLNQGTTTIDGLKDFFRRKYEKDLQSHRDEITKMRAILDDVRNGRASNENYQVYETQGAGEHESPAYE